jgi:hypothetical protein
LDGVDKTGHFFQGDKMRASSCLASFPANSLQRQLEVTPRFCHSIFSSKWLAEDGQKTAVFAGKTNCQNTCRQSPAKTAMQARISLCHTTRR